jgi:hypothetical protein
MAMKNRLAVLSCRRRVLLDRIDAQRMDVAGISLGLQKPLALAGIGLKAARFMHNHPGLAAGGLAALLALRGKGVAGLAKKGWRLIFLYPAIISFGLKYLLFKTRFPAEALNSDVDHSQW